MRKYDKIKYGLIETFDLCYNDKISNSIFTIINTFELYNELVFYEEEFWVKETYEQEQQRLLDQQYWNELYKHENQSNFN